MKEEKKDMRKATGFHKSIEMLLKSKKGAFGSTSEYGDSPLQEHQMQQGELELLKEELRRVENEYETLRVNYAYLYDFAPISYITFTKEGIIREANFAAARQFHKNRNAFVNESLYTFIHPEDRDAFSLHLMEIMESEKQECCEIRLKDEGGAWFYAQLYSVRIPVEDLSVAYICRTAIINIDKNKQIEEKLTQTEKLNSLGVMVAGIVHEINNPIGAIYLCNQESLRYCDGIARACKSIDTHIISVCEKLRLLREHMNVQMTNNTKKEKDKREKTLSNIFNDMILQEKSLEESKNQINKNEFYLRKYVQNSLKESKRSKELVHDLLEFSRQKEPKKNLSNVNAVIKNVLSSLVKPDWKNIFDVILDLDGNVPSTMIDRRQIEMVFMNIINNAVLALEESRKYSTHLEEGKKGMLKITSLFHADAHSIEVVIKDSGTGIDRDIFTRIFDPFFSTRSGGIGTGLGLSIAYKIIKSHNGNIEMNSKKQKGTTFRVILPLVNSVS
ncbi:MAG: ATP-binding protein [Candidatus Brocadiaceae bacterium]|nr:ATP-binding protein [Candidatus Brocadiaceae bacterium]